MGTDPHLDWPHPPYRDGEVIWSGAQPEKAGTVEDVSKERKDQAVWLKLVDPDEREGEQIGVYERILAA
jgi:hypothetical protein